MMPTLRQQLVKRRTLLGAVTLFCLLWHILLPTMVHVGLVPALFVMPTHCQPAMLAVNAQGSAAPHAQHASHDHAAPDHSSHNHTAMQQSMAAPAETDRFNTQHAHEVFALAAKIMKHCPLCSHGLEGGILAPILALVFILLACWFAVVRSLCHTWTITAYIPRFSFVLPLKHAPPFAL
jgi:hypothetical protein